VLHYQNLVRKMVVEQWKAEEAQKNKNVLARTGQSSRNDGKVDASEEVAVGA
jgi:hypothetical protein